jgi:hypothetical protein
MFERGKPKTGGRLPGVANKFTGAFREAVQIVYNRLGGHTAFLEWARDNPSEYYRIAARLIPGEMQEGNGAGNLTVIVRRYPESPVERPALVDHSLRKGEPS